MHPTILINKFLQFKALNETPFYTKDNYDQALTFISIKHRLHSILKALHIINLDNVFNYDKDIELSLIKEFKYTFKLKNSQINARLILWRSVLKFCDFNPLFKRISLTDDTKPHPWLNSKEVKILLNHLENTTYQLENFFKIKAAIYIILESGIRLMELRNLKIQNIDLSKRLIYLERAKNKQVRIVSFHLLTAGILVRLIAESNGIFLFDNEDGSKWSTKKMSYWFNIVRKNTAIPALTPHVLRKTFAMKLLDNSCNITTIMKLLGHSQLKTTLLYLNLNDSLIIADYRKKAPVYN